MKPREWVNVAFTVDYDKRVGWLDGWLDGWSFTCVGV
jgi:hypothetical protein